MLDPRLDPVMPNWLAVKLFYQLLYHCYVFVHIIYCSCLQVSVFDSICITCGHKQNHHFDQICKKEYYLIAFSVACTLVDMVPPRYSNTWSYMIVICDRIQHNVASLNLLYKPLVTIGKILM